VLPLQLHTPAQSSGLGWQAWWALQLLLVQLPLLLCLLPLLMLSLLL
jgi:hypothetical protein